jgi:ribose-phosphate pyrophosphokinase
VLSGNAIERIKNSPLEKVVMSNSIPARDLCDSPMFQYLSIAPLLAEAVKSIHEESSVSRLFI